MSAAARISRFLQELGDPEIAAHAQRFFKTGPGQYGEGDRFLGIRVPVLRRHLRPFQDTPLDQVERLLHSPWHEVRLFALLLMVRQFACRGADRAAIYRCYLANTAHINNWDLVDSSAPQIVGGYLEKRDRKPLYRLAASTSLWERRIAVLATLHFIRLGELDDTFALAERLLGDPEDLMHKAVGWMLREAGKRDPARLRTFIERHGPAMPRTLLRYAIEKFPPNERKAILAATAP